MFTTSTIEDLSTGSCTAAPSPKRFALIGAAGFIAPRHMQAIRDTGHQLIVALDKSDSVGIIDSYFPDAAFFTEFERFDRHVEKLRLDNGEHVDYVAICSPNYLHDSHVRFALRVGANAICEKPLVINPWNLDQLQELEDECRRRVYTVLQLRLHPAVQALKKSLAAEANRIRRDICLTYITRRGHWYQHAWKGSEEKSGGLAMNIGIHFFDLLLWLFGRPERSIVHQYGASRISGYLELEWARVRWLLSVEYDDLPEQVRRAGGYAYRSLAVDGEELDLSSNFTDLHTEIYRDILAGGGFCIGDARPSIELVYQVRHSRESATNGFAHPMLRK